MSSAHITIKSKHTYKSKQMKYERKELVTITTHDTVNDAKKLV